MLPNFGNLTGGKPPGTLRVPIFGRKKMKNLEKKKSSKTNMEIHDKKSFVKNGSTTLHHTRIVA